MGSDNCGKPAVTQLPAGRAKKLPVAKACSCAKELPVAKACICAKELPVAKAYICAKELPVAKACRCVEELPVAKACSCAKELTVAKACSCAPKASEQGGEMVEPKKKALIGWKAGAKQEGCEDKIALMIYVKI